MSGSINRVAMDASFGDCEAAKSSRNFGNGHSRPSALQLFVQAKKRINDIFLAADDFVSDAAEFVQGVGSFDELGSSVDTEIISPQDVKSVNGFKGTVSSIRDVLARDHMKVVFFGRTSNGKSTVINAMLREKVLPSGLGHTTDCFIQVEGSENEEASIMTEDSNLPKSISSITDMASALSSEKKHHNSLIRILWPQKRCRFLREDVVFLDSPGIDVSADLDLWIDRFCLDADVFVLVSNSESTLMQTEKNFFHKVNTRLSKPNIFVLQNRWDISERDEEIEKLDIDKVKQQHIDYNIRFLADELQVLERKEAKDRVFFVSAREVLMFRTQTVLRRPDHIPLPGFQARMFEFDDFEKKFEVCISKSAVRTKFKQHAERGNTIISDIGTIMNQVSQRCRESRRSKEQSKKEHQDKLDFLLSELDALMEDVKRKIRSMVLEVEQKVALELNKEIKRLSLFVEEFDRPFRCDGDSLDAYKKELHAYIQETMGRNLQCQCTAVLVNGVETMEKEMTDRLIQLLSGDSSPPPTFYRMPKRNMDIAYMFDCSKLCADFSEDLRFQFSLGPTALLKTLLGFSHHGFKEIAAGHLDASVTATVERTLAGDKARLVGMLLSRLVSLSTKTTFSSVIVLLVVGLTVVLPLTVCRNGRHLIVLGGSPENERFEPKAAGWRIVAIIGSLWAMLYMYERLSWTTRAKERRFKQQFVEYSVGKLRLIVDLTSFNCSHQVQQELMNTFNQLCQQADLTKEQLETMLSQLDAQLMYLDRVAGQAKNFVNRAHYLDGELNSFRDYYLRIV